MAEFRSKCPECGRTNNPLDADQCSCGHRFDPDREEIWPYQRVQEEKARRKAEFESASAVRIVEIKLTFANVFGLSLKFWFASLLWALMVGAVGGVVYGLVLSGFHAARVS